MTPHRLIDIYKKLINKIQSLVLKLASVIDIITKNY